MAQGDKKKILVVEDDPKTADLIAIYLEREGFHPLIARNGETGLEIALRESPLLVILDLMLPKLDGWEVCRRLRLNSDIPVIMLTARGEEIDRVAGLTLGADDYVVKPFSPRELVARVQAVLRRSVPVRAPQKGIFTHGILVLDTENRRLTIEGRPVTLTPHEYSLIKALMQRPGRVFNRDELVDRLYPKGDAVVIERVVDVHIGKLRQKIEPIPSAPRFILTVRGVGYRFADTEPSH